MGTKKVTGSIKTSKVALNWIKNASGSLANVGGSIASDLAPNSIKFTTGLAQESKDLINVIKATKQRATQMNSNKSGNTNAYKQYAKDFTKNLKDNLKSGDFREKIVDEFGFDDFDLGMDDFDFSDDMGLGDDFNLDGDIDSEDTTDIDKSAKIAVNTTKAQIGAYQQGAATIANTINNQTNAQMSASVASEQSARQIAGVTHVLLNNVNSTLQNGLTTINDNLSLMVNFNASTMTTLSTALLAHLEQVNSQKYSREGLIPEARDKIAGGYKNVSSKLEKQREDLASSLNMGDIGAYKNIVKNNLKNIKDSSMELTMLQMLFANDGSGGLIDEYINNPLNKLMGAGGKALLGKKMKDMTKRLDEGVGSFIPGIVDRFNRMRGSSNDVSNFLGELLGTDLSVKKSVNKSNWSNGPMEWDGTSHKTLNDVIPFYLRKITAAVTGEEEVVYDGNSNRFKTLTSAKHDLKSELRMRQLSNYSTYEITNGLDAFTFNDYRDRSDFEKKINDFLVAMTESNIKINPKFLFDKDSGKDYFEEKINFDVLSADANLDMNEQKMFKALLRNMGKMKVGQLFSTEMNNAILSNNEFFRGFEENDPNRILGATIFGEEDIKHNTHMKKNPYYKPGDSPETKYAGAKVSSIGGMGMDEYEKTGNDYLRDIRGILLNGIRTISYNAGNVNGVNNSIETGLGSFASEIGREKKTSHINIRMAENMIKSRDFSESDMEYYHSTGQVPINGIDSLDYSEDEYFRMMNSYTKNNEGERYHRRGKSMVETLIDKIPQGEFKNRATEYLRKNQEIRAKVETGQMTAVEFGEDMMFELMYGNGSDIINTAKNSSYGKGVVDMVGRARRFMTGKGYTTSDGTVYDDSDNSVWGNIKKTASTAKDALIVKVFGNTDDDKGGLLNKFSEGAQDIFGSLSSTIFGTTFKNKDGKFDKGLVEKGYNSFKNTAKKNLPEIAAGGIIGGAASLFSPLGILPSLFLPGGPIAGMLLGSGISMATKSETLKNYLFGEKDDDGKRKGKYFSKASTEWLTKNKKTFLGGGVLGAGLNLAGITQLGLLPSFFLPGGPVGAAIMGIGTSMVLKSQAAQDFLFGKKDEAGKYLGGLLSNVKNKMMENKEVGKAGLGKIAGGIAGGMLSTSIIGNFGLMGSMLTLGGSPILGAGLGIAAAMKLRGNSWMDTLFGKKDDDGKREGGLFSKGFNKMQTDLVLPLKTKLKETVGKSKDWFMETLGIPIKVAFEPVTAILKDSATRFGNWMSKKKRGAQDFLSGLFKEHIGDPVAGFAKKLFGGVFGLVKGLGKGALKIGGAMGTMAGGAINLLGDKAAATAGKRNLKDYRNANNRKYRDSKFSQMDNDDAWKHDIWRETGQEFSDEEWAAYKSETEANGNFSFMDKIKANYFDTETIGNLKYGEGFMNKRKNRKKDRQKLIEEYRNKAKEERAKVANLKDQDAMRQEMAKEHGYLNKDKDGNSLAWLYDPRTTFNRDKDGKIQAEKYVEQSETQALNVGEIKTETVQQTNLLKDLRQLMVAQLEAVGGGSLPGHLTHQFGNLSSGNSVTVGPSESKVVRGATTHANMSEEEKNKERRKHAIENAKIADAVENANDAKIAKEQAADAKRTKVSSKNVFAFNESQKAKEEEAEDDKFKSTLINTLEDSRDENATHHKSWLGIFGKNGLLTVGVIGLLAALPGIFKYLTNFLADKKGPEEKKVDNVINHRLGQKGLTFGASVLDTVNKVTGKKMSKGVAGILGEMADKVDTGVKKGAANAGASIVDDVVSHGKDAVDDIASKAANTVDGTLPKKNALMRGIDTIKRLFNDAIEKVFAFKTVIAKFSSKESAAKCGKDLIKKFSKAFTKETAEKCGKKVSKKLLELSAHVAATSAGPFKLAADVLCAGWDLTTGSTDTETARMFVVAQSEVDWLMKIVAGIAKMIMGFGLVGPIFDIITEFVTYGLGLNIKQAICTFVYGALASDVSEKELAAAQKAFADRAAELNKTVNEHNAEENAYWFDKLRGDMSYLNDPKVQKDREAGQNNSRGSTTVSTDVNHKDLFDPNSDVAKQREAARNGGYKAPSANGGNGDTKPVDQRGGNGNETEGEANKDSNSAEVINDFVYYGQTEEPWSTHPYGVGPDNKKSSGGNDKISQRGCGVTSMAMVLSQLTKQGYTPDQLADYSRSKGFNVDAGTSWSFFPSVATDFGLDLKQLNKASADELKTASPTNPIVLSGQGAHPFTKGGHFIVATGYDESTDKVRINDPASRDRNGFYPVSQIAKDNASGWQYSGTGNGSIQPRGTAGKTGNSSTGGETNSTGSSGASPLGFLGSKMAEILGAGTKAVMSGNPYETVNIDFNSQGGGTTSDGNNGTSTPMNAAKWDGTKYDTSGYDMNGLSGTQKQHIEQIIHPALETYKTHNLFPSITIAQSALESGWGPTSGLAKDGKNLYGIKTGGSKNWSGPVYNSKTREVVNGKDVTVDGAFRAYENYGQSVVDRANFLSKGTYQKAGVMTAGSPRDQVQAMKNAGYATDPKYVNLMMGVVDSANLTRFDKIKPPKEIDSRGGNGDGVSEDSVPYGLRTKKPCNMLNKKLDNNIEGSPLIKKVDQRGGNGDVKPVDTDSNGIYGQTIKNDLTNAMNSAKKLTQQISSQHNNSPSGKLYSEVIKLLSVIAENGNRTVAAIKQIDIPAPIQGGEGMAVAPLIDQSYSKNKAKDRALNQKEKRYEKAYQIAMGQ